MESSREDREVALKTLVRAYTELVDRLTGAVHEVGHTSADETFGFSWREMEDRYAPRVHHLQILIGALQGSLRKPARIQNRVVSFHVADGADLQQRVNEEIADLEKRESHLESLTVLPGADGGGYQVVLHVRHGEKPEGRTGPA